MLKNGENLYKEIEYLKAFAIIVVVLNHASKYFSGNLPRFIILLFEYSSPLFIFVAGTLCKKHNDLKKYFKNKFLRILAPFIFFTSLKILFSIFISNEFSHGNSFMDLLFEGFILGSMYWFCYCISWQFIVAPCMWGNKKIQLFLLLISVLVCSALKFSVPPLDYCYFQIYRALYHLPFFIMGMLCHQWIYNFDKKMDRYKIVLMALSLIIILGYTLDVFRVNSHLQYILNIVYRMSCIYLSIVVVNLISFDYLSNILMIVGKYSYQIMFLDSALNVFFFKIIIKFFSVNTFVYILAVITIVAVSCVICKIAEKNKILSTCFGLKYTASGKDIFR